MKTNKCFVPAFSQLAEDLREQIESGQLKPRDMISSEAQLGIMYGISRMTVRRGLAILVEAGLLETVHGKGNFVTEPNLDQATIIFKENNTVDEGDRSFKLLGIKRVGADAQIASKLKLPEGTKVFMLKRLILGENDPIAVDVKYLPYTKGKPMVENEIKYTAFPEMVAKHADVMIHKIEMGISATTLTIEEAELLKTVPGHPALSVIQMIYSKDEKPLGMSKITYRGEMFELKAVSYPYSGKR